MARFRRVGATELRKAARFLEQEERKWNKGWIVKDDPYCGPVCALGALFFANAPSTTVAALINKANADVGDEQPLRSMHVALFLNRYIETYLNSRITRELQNEIVRANDAKGAKRRDIIRFLRKTANQLEKA